MVWSDVFKDLQSPLVLLLLGFLLTTVLGGFVASKLQETAWERRTKLELFLKRYEEGTALLDELSSLVDRRFFALQRFY